MLTKKKGIQKKQTIHSWLLECGIKENSEQNLNKKGVFGIATLILESSS